MIMSAVVPAGGIAFAGGATTNPKPLLVISNTVPAPFAPPPLVVPNRLPLASASRLPYGLAPLALLKLTRVGGVPESPAPVVTTSNAVASPCPPQLVVLNRLPLASAIRLPCGLPPLVKSKLTRVVGLLE